MLLYFLLRESQEENVNIVLNLWEPLKTTSAASGGFFAPSALAVLFNGPLIFQRKRKEFGGCKNVEFVI